MNSSTFSPTSGGSDTLTLEQCKGQGDGVFGSGSDEPTLAVLSGVPFVRAQSTGQLAQVGDGDIDPATLFRRLSGVLSVQVNS